MENSFYNYSEISKVDKAWVKNDLGHKRRISFKRVLSTKQLLILIDFNSSRHFGFRNREDLLTSIGLQDIKTDLWIDPDSGKVFRIKRDRILDSLLKKDPSFKLYPIFSQLTNLKPQMI